MVTDDYNTSGWFVSPEHSPLKPVGYTLVLFGMQIRNNCPYYVNINRILVSVMVRLSPSCPSPGEQTTCMPMLFLDSSPSRHIGIRGNNCHEEARFPQRPCPHCCCFLPLAPANCDITGQLQRWEESRILLMQAGKRAPSNSIYFQNSGACQGVHPAPPAACLAWLPSSACTIWSAQPPRPGNSAAPAPGP
jgi:hypothetical protein